MSHDLLFTWSRTKEGYDLIASGRGSEKIPPGKAFYGSACQRTGRRRAYVEIDLLGCSTPKTSGVTRFSGTTIRTAMKACERDFDHRSIGLFGTDVLNFEIVA